MKKEKLSEAQIASILRGIEDAENGRFHTSEEVREKTSRWRKENSAQETEEMLNARISHYEKHGENYTDFDEFLNELENDF